MPTPTLVDADVPRGRALHLVDLENLLQGTHEDAGVEDATWALSRFCRKADWHRDDLDVVAANPGLLGRIAYDLPRGWQKVAAAGADGADRALLERAEPGLVRHRFYRLVVGSGDGIFADLAEAVRDAGGEVWVVGVGGHVSRRLARSASTLVLLDEPAAPGAVRRCRHDRVDRRPVTAARYPRA